MRYHTASEQNYALLATKERWNIPLSPPIITDYNAILRWEWNIWVRAAMILNSALETVIYTLPILFHMFLQKRSLQKACFEFLAKNDNCLNFLQFACWKSAFAHFRNKCTFSTNWGSPSPNVPYKIPPTNVLIRFAKEVGSCIQIQSFTIPVTQTSCDIIEWATNCKHHLLAPHTISHFFHASLLRQRFFQRCRVLLPQHPYPKSCSS